MLDKVLISASTGKASVGTMLVVLLLIVCYFSQAISMEDEERIDEKRGNAVWYVSAMMLIISFGMDNLFYRLLLYVPYLTILILSHPLNNTALSVFFMAILGWMRMFAGGYECPQNMNTQYVIQTDWMIKLCEHFGSSKYMIYDGLNEKILEKMPDLSYIVGGMNGIALLMAGILLVISHRRWKRTLEFSVPIEVSETAYTLCMPCFFGNLLYTSSSLMFK